MHAAPPFKTRHTTIHKMSLNPVAGWHTRLLVFTFVTFYDWNLLTPYAHHGLILAKTEMFEVFRIGLCHTHRRQRLPNLRFSRSKFFDLNRQLGTNYVSFLCFALDRARVKV